jgi:hypothetical protein
MVRILGHLRAGKGILKTARECGVGAGTVQRIAEENGPFDAKPPPHGTTPLNVSRSLPLMAKAPSRRAPRTRETHNDQYRLPNTSPKR